jgi:hypothetical protein
VRKFIAIILLIVVGASGSWVLYNRPQRSPIELQVVSSTPLDSTNLNEFMLVTLSLSNRVSEYVVLESKVLTQAKVGGDWIEVDRSFYVNPVIGPGGNIQKSLTFPAGATVGRLQFKYTFIYYRPGTWRHRLLRRLLPMVEGVAVVSSWVRNWYEAKVSELKEIVIEVEIPQNPSQPVSRNDPLHSTP